ncbi:MAG: RsmD family RNA methyltransferase [Prevotella sp.]|nr:RsmD family RNA methyltransferase [Bacteroides sp.]MCM1365902.1 RsmD family RNA methyltransferase [Prevotella sp.]
MYRSFEDFKQFISDHISENPNILRLKYAKSDKIMFGRFSAIDQIEARQKSATKIPSFIKNKDFIFPSILSSEQASNQEVAKYHASLIDSDKTVLDLTTGLGIDAMTIARKVKYVTAIERFEDYTDALVHNIRAMNIDNIDIINDDSIKWIQKEPQIYDVIFVDPARRGANNRKTFAFEDCEPDIKSNHAILMQYCKRMMIKSSPMLDITAITKQIPQIINIHVVSYKGECKEILIECVKDYIGNITVICVNIGDDKVISSFKFPIEMVSSTPSHYLTTGDYLKYLYEPNAEIMKTGAWKALCNRFPDLNKIAKNTHLFMSDTLYDTFPGRILETEMVLTKSDINHLKGESINIVCRNYPLSAEAIKNKFKFKGDSFRFIYCFKNSKDNPIRLLVKKLVK